MRRYIAEQEIHHSNRDFRDEFVELLVKNGVEFDDRYLELGTLPPAIAGFR
ncbi:MAG TPA: hypothetical protein PKC89_12645 [Pyrinomonadaceae bacterium]|nr:hypothetical protein [Pyrinomonadaceae bacterium]